MTTTEATAPQPHAEFPIQWDDAAAEQLFWFQDVMLNPLPITPLNAKVVMTLEEAGR